MVVLTPGRKVEDLTGRKTEGWDYMTGDRTNPSKIFKDLIPIRKGRIVVPRGRTDRNKETDQHYPPPLRFDRGREPVSLIAVPRGFQG